MTPPAAGGSSPGLRYSRRRHGRSTRSRSPQEPDGGAGACSRASTRARAAALLGPERRSTAATASPLAGSRATRRRLVTAGNGEVTVRDAATLRAGSASPSGRRAAAPDRLRAEPGRPHARDRRRGRRGAAPRPAQRRGRGAASGRHGGAVTGAALHRRRPHRSSPAGDDGDVIVWDVAQGTAGETLSGHASGVFSLRLDARRADALQRQPRRHGVRLGPRRRSPPRPAVHAPAPAASSRIAAELRRPAARDGPGRRRDQHRRRAHARRRASLPGRRHRRARAASASFPAATSSSWAATRRLPGAGRRRLGAGASGACRGHRGPIITPGISADGRLLVATGTDDGSVRFWSLPDGAPLGAPLRFHRQIFNAQLSPDGRWLSVVLVSPDSTSRRRGDLGRSPSPSRRPCAADGTAHDALQPRQPAAASVPATAARAVWSTETWKPVTRSLAADATRDHAGARSAATAVRSPPAARTAPCGCGTSRPSRPSARRCRACPARGRTQFTRDGTRLHRQLRDRPRVPLGHPARVAHPPGLRGRRAAPHARRVGGVPARPRLRPRLLSAAGEGARPRTRIPGTPAAHPERAGVSWGSGQRPRRAHVTAPTAPRPFSRSSRRVTSVTSAARRTSSRPEQ